MTIKFLNYPLLAFLIGFSSPSSLAQTAFFTSPTCPHEKQSSTWDNCVGEFVFNNGYEYTGEWQKGRASGWGRLSYPDGSLYLGQFFNDRPSQVGILFRPDGGVEHAGWWGDGKPRKELDLGSAIFQDKFFQPYASEIHLFRETARLSPGTISANQDSQKRIALLIGNATYTTSPLANPVNDVRGMATALRKAGFTVIKHENLNFRQMREAVRDFGEKLSKDQVGLFYYSGHGVQVDGRNYLIPVNSDIKYEDEVASSALDAEMVLAKLESAKNKLNIVVLDACRDSPLGRRTRTSTKGLSNMNAASGTMIAFSTAPGQVALDGKGSNSPYTKHLISAIQKEGLLLEQVFKEVRGNVMKDTNGTQVPWENSSILGDFYFVPKK